MRVLAISKELLLRTYLYEKDSSLVIEEASA